jgi:uncharacterized protein YciI
MRAQESDWKSFRNEIPDARPRCGRLREGRLISASTPLAPSDAPALRLTCPALRPTIRHINDVLRGVAMKHFLLFYDFAPDYLERRVPLRGDHLKFARAAQARGELLLGGAVSDPLDSAAILFVGEDRSVAERFAEADPYVQGGLVKAWRVREWVTVVGADALTEVRE